MARAVGIDLGTTSSVAAILEGGEPTVIANAEGSRTTPSVVAFAKNAEVLVGEVAKRQAVTNVDRTIRSVKRHMGTDWTVNIDGKKFTPQQISAFVLQKLKREAEAYLGERITDAVITTPAYFNDAQRQATKEAGQIAGLNVLRIIAEPTAAALAYHLEKEGEATILVFDLGGGSFDVSLLEVGEGVVEVKATSGDIHLGGDDWDQRIVDWLVKDFKVKRRIDLSKDKVALERLREAAEKAKIELSQSMESQINLPYISHSADGPLHLDAKLTRAEFQRMTSDLLDRCKAPFQQVIKDAGIKLDDLHHVVLVGGSTRMPAVVDLVKSLTGGKEPNKGVNPYEVVAVGACLQAGVLRGEVKDVLLLDVIPLSLGIETKGGIFTKLIERNTTIPTKRSEIFSTTEDDQTSYMVQVFQGEREIAAYNKKLGMFELAGIAPAPRGVPQIEVTFAIDANGIVNVSAKDLGTGKQQSVQITGGSALAKDDIEKMVRDAEEYAEEDRKRREEAEVRNQADTLVYSTEKFLGENEDKVPEDIKSEVRDALAEVKKALESNDTDTIKSATRRAAQASQKMGTAIYQQAQAERQQPDEAELVSEEKAKRELRTLPAAPPQRPRAVGDGPQVQVNWDRGAGHDESTIYAVRRTAGRAPADPADGDEVYQGPGTGCTDSSAPVGQPVYYGVFAVVPGKPPSRPATAGVTLLPPVTGLSADVGPAVIELRWFAHPDAEVRITRSIAGQPPITVPVRGSSCRVTGLPAGRQQRFEVTAVYRGPQGEELSSVPEQITAVPAAPPARAFPQRLPEPDRPHLDFDVLFSRSGEDYRALITRSPAGEGQSVIFRRLFTEDQLQNLVLKVGMFRAPRTRRIASPAVQAAKNAGGKLFDAVFTGPVGECLRRSRDRAEDQQATLRIRFQLADCPELSDLPWEFLYEQSQDWFLALSARTPLIRYVPLPDRPRPVRAALPLRILVIKSEPADYDELNLDDEWAHVASELGDLVDDEKVAITELAQPTLRELNRTLRRDTFHVLHYMGHGDFSERAGGSLLFTDASGRGVPVTAEDLGVVLHDHRSLRLAVLNTCNAGRADASDPFAGIADTLVRRGIPAVVAMQFAVTDRAAVEFAPAFYGTLAEGRPVDVAVSEARKAIRVVSPLEWVTPVLYLRADDAHLFEIV